VVLFVGFVCFVTAAGIGLVLLTDTLYARPGLRHRLALAQMPHQARAEELAQAPAEASSALPPDIRPRLRLAAFASLLLGAACLLLGAV